MININEIKKKFGSVRNLHNTFNNKYQKNKISYKTAYNWFTGKRNPCAKVHREALTMILKDYSFEIGTIDNLLVRAYKLIQITFADDVMFRSEVTNSFNKIIKKIRSKQDGKSISSK